MRQCLRGKAAVPRPRARSRTGFRRRLSPSMLQELPGPGWLRRSARHRHRSHDRATGGDMPALLAEQALAASGSPTSRLRRQVSSAGR